MNFSACITPSIFFREPLNIGVMVVILLLALPASAQIQSGVRSSIGEGGTTAGFHSGEVVQSELQQRGVEIENTTASGVDSLTATADEHPQVSELDSLPVNALPHNLSPWGMFVAADNIVKAVMILLALASLLTWTVLLAKNTELRKYRRLLRHNLEKIARSHTLAEAANADGIDGISLSLIEAAEIELQLSPELEREEFVRDTIKSGIKERVVSSLSRIEGGFGRRLLTGTGLLATTGAVAPFVGLFGTVWGIMNSFIGISKANTTNLAVVAPGIAEALLATALGLVAAIPAVVIYNHFTRQITSIKALVADCTAAILRLVSRDLDRGTSLRLVTSPQQKVD